MSSIQLHLGLTHVPVILTITALIMLILGVTRKQSSTVRIANILLIIAALVTIPVYFSGEGAEHVAEEISGVSESTIEAHEEIAKFSFLAIIVAGMSALVSLIFSDRNWSKSVPIITLVICFVTSGLFIQTAHLGGTVRHTELTGNNSPVEIANQIEEDD